MKLNITLAKFSLYDKEEQDIFNKIHEKVNKDLKIWNLANLIFPIATILVSLLLYFFSSKSPLISNSYTLFFENFLDFLLNGSIPLIGINLLVACSFFLIKFDKHREKALGLTTNNLRMKLIIFSLISYLILSILFAIQNIYSPFNSIYKSFFLLTLSIIGIWFSVGIANKIFLLQEEYIEKSYDETITDNVKILKSAIKA